MRWSGARGGGRRRRLALGGSALGLAVVAAVAFGADLPAVWKEVTALPSERMADEAPPEVVATDLMAEVLTNTEVTWRKVFLAEGGVYQDASRVVFRGSVEPACGHPAAAVGPFYCPGDRRLYLDRAFFDALSDGYGAPGVFAQAYVIAHEVGHHVQNILGVSRRVRALQRASTPAEANSLAVQLELQADCLAGIWGAHAGGLGARLNPADLEKGLAAAAAVGDVQLQQRARGFVVPEGFTHGSSAQRVEWFSRGFATGDLAACDTFTRPVHGRRPH